MYMYLYFKKYLSYITTNSLISPILFDEIKIMSSFSYSIYAFIEAYWLTLAFSVHHTYVLAYALHNGYIIVNVKISRHNSFQMIKHLKICKKPQKHKYFFSPCFYRTWFGFGRIEFLPKQTETNEFDAMGHGLE